MKFSDSPSKVSLAQQLLGDNDTLFYPEDTNDYQYRLMSSSQCFTKKPETPTLSPVQNNTAHQEEYFQYADIDTESCSSQISVSDTTNEVIQAQSHAPKEPNIQTTKDRKKNDTNLDVRKVQGINQDI